MPQPERRMMLAARYHGPGSGLRLESLDVPRPGHGEAVLRVLAAGLCHTDLQFLTGAINFGVVPLTLGHEIAGEVIETGDGATGVRAGDRVVVYYYSPCGECPWCAVGQGQVCPNAGPQIGFSADGGFAEFVAVPARNLIPLPAGVDPADAAVLACAGASAYHALFGVGGLTFGERVAIYGVGGVGLLAVQFAHLAGAHVIALGRSADKLSSAAGAGAHVTVNARAEDPVAAVRAATGNEGADAVLDLVGTRETLANSLAMLRRRGRLVCLGYSGEKLDIDPLRLILTELQIRAAVGNSAEELRAVLRLAAEGRIKPVTAQRRPLNAVNDAIDQLRRGAVNGRVVLEPRSAGTGGTGARRHAPADALEADLLAVIGRGLDAPRNDAQFEALALRLFEYQFRCNEPYRAFCRRRNRTPDTVTRWREIPAIPIAAFKFVDLVCGPPSDAAACFRSSGTTRPHQRSRHFHPSLAVYDLNATLNFEAHVLPDGPRLPFLVLFPPPSELPDSSLAYWLALMLRRFGAPGSDWVVRGGKLEAERLASHLRELEHRGQPACLLAASFSLLHFLDFCEANGERLRLPAGSRLMDTGGYKGRSREVTRGELYRTAAATLGIPEDHIVNMYGMTEHSTQFLDAVLRNRTRGFDYMVAPSRGPSAGRESAGMEAPRYKTVPPWARTLVVDPATLEPVPAGETGLLLHYDLANRGSVLAVLSEDLGHELGEGFELVGRVEESEARGCSIAIDELLGAVKP